MTDYRYVGLNPNNYVCFGSEENSCPDDNLYRIIGVIPIQATENGIYENRVKLIKNVYYNEAESGLSITNPVYIGKGYGYRWHTTDSNKWETSLLNTKVLNEVYWNSLGSYKRYIESSKWYLGAISINDFKTLSPNQYYALERGIVQGYSKGGLSYLGNIGLMYPSDYLYSLGLNYKDEIANTLSVDYVKNSWLFVQETEFREWLITPESVDGTGWNLQANICPFAFSILPNGGVAPGITNNLEWALPIRPTFYLKSTILYESGIGTKENPYRVKYD